MPVVPVTTPGINKLFRSGTPGVLIKLFMLDVEVPGELEFFGIF